MEDLNFDVQQDGALAERAYLDEVVGLAAGEASVGGQFQQCFVEEYWCDGPVHGGVDIGEII